MEGGLDSRLAGPVPLPSVAGTYSRLAGQLRWLLKHDVKFQISCDPISISTIQFLEQTVPWGRRQIPGRAMTSQLHIIMHNLHNLHNLNNLHNIK